MTNEEQLEQRIALALSAYFDAGEQIAQKALDRALTRKSGSAMTARSKSQSPASRVDGRRKRKRSREELDRLCEALCVAVSAHPGESMRFLAEKLGERPSQLTAIVSRLKRANRIRTVGARQFTRYFPSTETARAATS